MRVRETLGLVVVLGLAALVVLQLQVADATPPIVVPTTDAAAVGRVASTAPGVTTTDPPAAPTTTAAQSTTTTLSPEVLRVIADTRAALDAWGRFATTGDLAELWATFAIGGPQRRQLWREAAALAANPPGDPPYVFTMSPTSVTLEGDVAFVSAKVVLSRQFEPDQSFTWLIEMRLVEGTYRLWTVTDV